MNDRQPFNLGSRIVNNWLFPIQDGYVLVDTGYETGYPAFCRALAQQGLTPGDLSYVFLTHAHDDHAGFLNELLLHSQARVILSPKAVPGLRRGQNAFQGGCAGRLALCFCKLMALVGRGAHRFPPVAPELESRFLAVDDSTRPGLERILAGKIIDTPGHTGCSISLLLDNGLLFCGDAAMNGLPSRKRITIWIEDLSCYVSSWHRIIDLGPALIYPGHGAPFPVSDLARFLPRLTARKLYPLTHP